MKTLRAVLSKGPEDFAAWLENFEGVYGAGDTRAKALESLNEALLIYAKYNADAPQWLKEGLFKLRYKT